MKKDKMDSTHRLKRSFSWPSIGISSMETTHMILRSLMLIVVVSLAVLLTFSCSKNEPPVRIGAALVLTGPAAFVGEEVRDGLTMAVEEINSHNGINGRRIELIIEDANAPSKGKSIDGTPVDSAQQAFDTLEGKDPLVMVTCLSFLSVKLAPLAEAKKRLMVGLVATAPELTENRQWVYRYWPTAEHEAPPMANLFRQLDTIGGGFGVIYLDDAYGGSVYKDLEQRCRAFGTTLIPAPFPVSQKQFFREAENVKDASAVAVIGFDGHIINALKALRDIGYKGDVISTTTATLPSVTALTEADGVYVTAPAIYNKNFHFTDSIKEKYQQKFGKPFTQYSANGYDFIYILSGLLEDQPVTPESFKTLLEKGFVYSGVFGNVELKKGKKDILFPLFPAQIQNGDIVYK